MTGTIVVKRIRKNGKYVSELDYDGVFADKNNPKGLFRMVIHPIENTIIYKKVKDGYEVTGEGYIISGLESEIEERVRKINRQIFHNVVHIEEA